MGQSDREKTALELGGLVRGLWSSAILEAKALSMDQYTQGKIAGYKVVFRALQTASGLEPSDFERKITDFDVAKWLGFETDGKYEVIYGDGKVLQLRTWSKDPSP